MSESTWLWIGFIGMALGSIVLLIQAGRRTPDEEAHGVLHIIVPMIAGGFYLMMALNQGSIIIDHGRELLFARYIDWSVTTPLLLLALSLTALRDLRKRLGLVLALIGADIYMILTGLLAAYSPTSSTEKWIWYLVSSGAFLAVYWVLWGPMRAEAERSGTAVVYKRNATILSIVWFIYPLVFLFGTDGLLIISPALSALCFTVLDLVAKVGYGLLSTAESKRMPAPGSVRPLPQA